MGYCEDASECSRQWISRVRIMGTTHKLLPLVPIALCDACFIATEEEFTGIPEFQDAV